MELPMPTTSAAATSAFISVESSDKSLPTWTSDDLGPFSELLEASNTSGPQAAIRLDLCRTYPFPEGYSDGRRATASEGRETEAATSVS